MFRFIFKKTLSPTILLGQKFRKGCQMANRVVHSRDQIFYQKYHKYILTFSKHFKEFCQELDSFQSWFLELVRVLSIFSCVPVSDIDLRQLTFIYLVHQRQVCKQEKWNKKNMTSNLSKQFPCWPHLQRRETGCPCKMPVALTNNTDNGKP